MLYNDTRVIDDKRKIWRVNSLMKIIDGHVHVYPPHIEKNWREIAESEPWFNTLISSKVNKWGTADELIRHMDGAGIEKALVTGFAFHDQGLCREVNDYVLDAAGRYQGRLAPMAVVSPARPGAEAEAIRCAASGAVGIGELFPDGQGFDIADGRQTGRLAGVCAEAGLFLMLHTAEQVGHGYPGKGSAGAVEAAAFCLNHPEVKVIFAHFGGGLWAYEAMPEMKRALANAYYDTAAWPWLYGAEIIDAIFAIGAGHKILYGSDWPILEYPRYEKLLAKSAISVGQKISLLRGNAERLLRGADETAPEY